jgi:hypothetical protein
MGGGGEGCTIIELLVPQYYGAAYLRGLSPSTPS